MQGIADVGRIESTLFARQSELVRSTSFAFSIAVLIVVLGGFGWFLSVQYEMNAQKPEEKRIPFVPTVWYSATRNVRNEEYAGQLQPFEIETRYGGPRPTDGCGPTEVHGVDYGRPTEGGDS